MYLYYKYVLVCSCLTLWRAVASYFESMRWPKSNLTILLTSCLRRRVIGHLASDDNVLFLNVFALDSPTRYALLVSLFLKASSARMISQTAKSIAQFKQLIQGRTAPLSNGRDGYSDIDLHYCLDLYEQANLCKIVALMIIAGLLPTAGIIVMSTPFMVSSYLVAISSLAMFLLLPPSIQWASSKFLPP